MWSGQFLFGGIFVLFSAFLRALARVHLRHPVYTRPRAFQSRRFLSLLSLVANVFFVLGFLTLFLIHLLVGVIALFLYPFFVLPGFVFLLGKIYT
ncbi:MAG: hypothetical protein HY282_00660 [Nitrospirae bacterium]|nr:hypothetical protein [Candidatus Manganitrophaceae bacterium]